MLLFLNSIAGSEIVIILLFVLIFFGAKSIPGLSRNLGRGIRQMRDASQDIQDEIRKTTTTIKREANVNRSLHQAREDMKKPFNQLSKSAEEMKRSIEGEKHPSNPAGQISGNEVERKIHDDKTVNRESE
jgi:sec-independent protein translocase protein TatA